MNLVLLLINLWSCNLGSITASMVGLQVNNSDPWTSQTTQLRPLPIQTPSDSDLPNSDHSRFRLPQFRPFPMQTPSIQTRSRFKPPKSDPPISHPPNSELPDSDPLTRSNPWTVQTPSSQTLPIQTHKLRTSQLAIIHLLFFDER